MRHILFVDDQSTILCGLERMLRPMRAEWRMTFVSNPSVALGVLAEDRVDVVVSDMRMPDLDGAAFLGQVRDKWPETVRIVLSGYADEGAALRSVPVAHRFLAKPCDPDVLLATVRDACELQDRLSRPDLRQLMGSLGSLPSSPESFTAISEALTQPDVHLRKVASIIARDPGCAAKLLQLVNSAFFGLAREVTRVDEAVAYLGLSRVRDVVLIAEVASMFHSSAPGLERIAEEINDHSMAVAAIAKQLVRPACSHDAFIAGVLHDIGRLALAVTVPDQYGDLERRRRAGEDIVPLELQQFGATHADVGAYLLRLWGLPFSLVEAVARHHDHDLPSLEDKPVVFAVACAVGQVEGCLDASAPASEVHSG